MSQDQRYVIQEHAAAVGTHWDLMLEMGQALWTWRLNAGPAQIGNQAVQAERIGDHPLRFLSYEGSVQNGTGYVRIRDQGHFRICMQTADMLILDIAGTVLRGRFAMYRTENPSWWRLQAEIQQS